MTKPPPEWAPEDPRRTPIVLRRELVAVGHDDRSIARLVRTGVLARVKRGAYADAGAFARLDDVGRYGLRNRAALKQAKTEVALSHCSAVPEYDAPTWGLDLRLTHLTRVDGRTGRKEAGIQQHAGTLEPGDVVERNGVAVMSATKTALDVCTIAVTEAALVVVAFFLHQGLTTIEELWARQAGMAHWPGTLHTEVVLRLARAELESVGETRAFYMFYLLGLPLPVLQYEVRDGTGAVVARVDFAWPELGIYVEFDGMVKYEKLLRPGERASDVVIRERRREELIGRLTGWRCVRLTWADLDHPERTGVLLRGALGVAA